MSDSAIIALFVSGAGGICMLMYFLIGSIRSQLKATTDEIQTHLKKTTDNMLTKIEKFIDELAEVREAVAVKSTMLDFMQRELETIKKNCWSCREKNKGKND